MKSLVLEPSRREAERGGAFGVGFIPVGDEWFLMWPSATWNGIESAFRYVTIAGYYSPCGGSRRMWLRAPAPGRRGSA